MKIEYTIPVISNGQLCLLKEYLTSGGGILYIGERADGSYYSAVGIFRAVPIPSDTHYFKIKLKNA